MNSESANEEIEKPVVTVALITDGAGRLLIEHRIGKKVGWAVPSGVGFSEPGVLLETAVKSEAGYGLGENLVLEDVKQVDFYETDNSKVAGVAVFKAVFGGKVEINPKVVDEYAFVKSDDQRLSKLIFDQSQIVKKYFIDEISG